MKVCLVVYHYYYRDSRLWRHAESLAEVGVQVDILCLRDPNHSFVSQKPGLRVLSVPVRHANAGLMSYLLHYTLAFMLFTLWLVPLQLINRYRIIQVHNMPDLLVFAAFVPRLLGARVILDIRDPMPEFFMSKFRRTPDHLLVRLLQLQERLSAHFAHAVITANDHFKRNLTARAIPPDKIWIVNNLPDPDVFNREAHAKRGSDDTFTLFYPGTIAPRYGLDIAIRALPQLVASIPQIRLVIMGGAHETYLAQLIALAEHLGVSAHVEFKSPVSVDQVPPVLAEADLGIYPALPDAHMDIATPSKVLEYAVMGIPIVASRLRILQDLFDDSAIMFFEPGNVDQFASCVRMLYENPTQRSTLVHNADTVFVHTHRWSHDCQVYLGLLQALTGWIDATKGWRETYRDTIDSPLRHTAYARSSLPSDNELLVHSREEAP